MPTVLEIPGFKELNTTTNPRSLDQFDLVDAHNMKWSGNSVVTRQGNKLWKNNNQWSGQKVIAGADFKISTDNFYYVIVVLDNGKVYYIRSDNASFGTASATWTEILSTGSTSPALSSSLERVSITGFNNKLYFADGTNNLYYWDGDSSTDLTSVVLPAAASTNNIVAVATKSYRLWALDDAGRTHASSINDGTDFTSAGTGFLSYGRVEGLKATNMTPFGDDLIISTEEPLTQKFQTYRLLGFQFFDPSVAGTDTGQFEIRKINTIAGIIGASGQEIAEDTIGLTPRGFIGIQSAINLTQINERSFISKSIKEIISDINFRKADKVYSTIDYSNGRYFCAIPYGEGASEASLLLVYDFLRSSQQEGVYRWTTWSFDFNEIHALFNISGEPYIADEDGNIYHIEDDDAGYADNGSAITYSVKTAPLGGKQIGSEKDFYSPAAVFTNLTAEVDIDIYPYPDNRVLTADAYGNPYTPIKVEPIGDDLRYDTDGVFYDDGNLYDSGASSERLVSFSNRAAKGQSLAWSFRTETTGVSWGIGGLSVAVEQAELSNRSGVDNSGDI